MIIRNIDELAKSLDTTVSDLHRHVRTYTDYETDIDWTDEIVYLTTCSEDEELTKKLRFPFTDDDYDDALCGLQCWADEVYCKAREAERNE